MCPVGNFWYANITIAIISSPSPVHPSTQLIDSVLNSLSYLDLDYTKCEIIIYLDGYVVKEKNESKRGRITPARADNYELFITNLQSKYGSFSNVKIIRSPSHTGYAFGVRKCLEETLTSYALVLQHDRVFIQPFSGMPNIMTLMEATPHIRYVGFPSVTNKTHIAQILYRYQLDCLATPDVQLPLGEKDYFLQPCVFWFDSNHFVHVKRYLEIFRPYINLFPELRQFLGLKRIKKLVMRPGDFIEDRFGQMQRDILTNLIVNYYTPRGGGGGGGGGG